VWGDNFILVTESSDDENSTIPLNYDTIYAPSRLRKCSDIDSIGR
jgi:hypothetical protein